jgi:CheY-like chemotaxis protein
LVENEPEWEARLAAVLRDRGFDPATILRTFTEAEREVQRLDLLPFAFAVVDVRLRRQLFDQGGLALLDQLKSRRPALPVLVLSAYFDDYPGLRKVTARYQRVVLAEKEAFVANPGPTLDALLKPRAGYDLFISYRREGGGDLAHLLRIALERRGSRVFLDVRELRAGPFDDALLRYIEAIPNFVVLLTPGCLDRCMDPADWFRREIAHALATGRRVIPVRREGFQPPSPADLPVDIAGVVRQQWVTFTGEFTDEAVGRLYDMLDG